MTPRERHTPAGGVAAPPAPPPNPSPTAGGGQEGGGAALACAWDELFQAASPGRRQQLMALAGRDGVLYAHELPPPGNGAAKRPLLPALLNGQLQDLAPLRPRPDEVADALLDDAQRDAVARALHTPDLCLIQGHPGSGKSHTAAEIVARAAARGERVLLLAPTAAAVDCVLERLEGRDGVCPIRCLAPGEKAETLPPGLRRRVFEERLRSFQEQTLPAAKQAAVDAERRHLLRGKEEGVWAELEAVARQREALADEQRLLTERLSQVEQDVEAETASADEAFPGRQALTACRSTRDEARARADARLSELGAERDKVRGEQRAAEEAIALLRPLAEALRDGRWWIAAWWRARREGDVAQRLDDAEKRRDERAATHDRLAKEAEEVAAERGRAEACYQDAAAEVRWREVERRRADCEQRRIALVRDQEVLEEKGRTACRGLGDGVKSPAELSVAAVGAAREAWSVLQKQDECEAARAAHWAEAVDQAMATLPERLTQCVNVVGAATSGLACDPRFGDHLASRVTFDLLVLEEAHLVTESEFLAAARRARRWVLIGEPTDEAPAPRRTTRPSTLRPGFFQRLWRLLHCDPRSLPYVWFHRGGRLACRLRPASPDEERWVQSEYLADRPEIELRIAAPPRTAPRLLEVVFPGSTTLHDAKALLFRELGELTVQARGGAFRWRDEADRVVLDLADGPAAETVAVDLADGVRERVAPSAALVEGGACWQTHTLEFDRAAGWTRDRAGQWLEEHLQVRDPGRTALLQVPHRCRPALARFLTSLLFNGAGNANLLIGGLKDNANQETGIPGDDAPAVEFVPVPPLEDEARRRRPEAEEQGRRGGTATTASRLRSSRGGAGLEIDLGDPRRLEPLPADLRAALPGRGLVNLFEARAVVRKLEAFAADAAFRAAVEEWTCRDVRSAGPAGTGCASASCQASAVPCVGRRPALAVLALYSAQAELIRLLMAQSPALAVAPVTVEVGTPDAFRHRECFTALISLTRSHSHRAVPFGDDPSWLATALTRAASRLVLFGDPGTLARRCQWNGAIDHLDESAGERERGLIAQITAYLHGHGPHPTTFRLDESGGV